MSTYYRLICHSHNESSDAASRTADGYCHYGYSKETLLPFLIAHAECDLVCSSEHNWVDDESSLDDKGEPPGLWKDSDVEGRVEKAKAANRWD